MANRKPVSGSGRAAIDWRDLERRLEAAHSAIEAGWTASPGHTQQILQARALALAAEQLPPQTAEAHVEVVEFILAHERYAVESRYVREVYPLENLTPLPCAPGFVLGIFNVRGEIISVIDLKKFFDLPEKGLTDLDKVLVLHSGKMLFGILADVILGVRHVALTDIQASLPTLTGIREHYLKGVTGERLVVLDAERLLADESIVVREQVAG